MGNAFPQIRFSCEGKYCFVFVSKFPTVKIYKYEDNEVENAINKRRKIIFYFIIFCVRVV